MYPPTSDHAHPPPPYNQPAAATGYPVNYNNNNPSVPPPASAPPPQFKSEVDWSTGLCDCFSDCKSCCMTLWCPCFTFGQIAEIVDKGSTSCGASGALYALINLLTGCGWIYSCFYRTKLRRQLMLKESPCSDCLLHCCCEPCALCQEYRELQNRGFDMTLGWHGNVEQGNRAVVAMDPTAPAVAHMSR